MSVYVPFNLLKNYLIAQYLYCLLHIEASQE